MKKYLLETTSLSCERDDRLLIENLNLKLSAGEVLQVEGPNGSGKTTLLRVLCGLASDYSGSIRWAGETDQLRPSFRQKILYFGHSTGIKPALTARENLAWVLSLSALGGESLPTEEQVDSALAAVGLAGYEDVPVNSLSAGQKRRVALARLRLEPAQLWVLDEPFTAIDRQGVLELEQLILRHAEHGGSVLITTHHALQMPTIRKLQLGLGRGQWQMRS